MAACDPGNDGYFRTDLCTSPRCDGNTAATEAGGGWFQQAVDVCISLSLNVTDPPDAPGPGDHGPMFAEEKSWQPQYPPWALALVSEDAGAHWSYVFSLLTDPNSSFSTAWTSPLLPGWHTISLCFRPDQTSAGVVYGLWLDGIAQSLVGQTSGFATLNPGFSSEPLDINAYGTAIQGSYTYQHGAPIVQENDRSSPPEPPWGWTGAP